MGLSPNDFTSIPRVDIAPLVEPSSLSERIMVAEDIRDACQRVGFFYIANHGVTPEEREEVLGQARAFFSRSIAEKMRIHIGKSSALRGYIPLGGERTGGLRDWHECLDFRPEFPPEHPDVISGKVLHGPNQWPEGLPHFRRIMDRHWQQMSRIGAKLTRGIALSLGLEETALDPYIEGAFSSMRFLHYPELSDPKPEGVGIGFGPHIDYGFLTILDQEQVGGLQVKNRAGDWVNAPYQPGTYVVNIGKATQIWTNDRYRATEHRVLGNPQQERFSNPFFFNPNFDTIIQPLAICCSEDNPPRYQPYCHGEFISQRFHTSFQDNLSS